MPEPSILDYLKEIFTPWKKRTIFLSSLEDRIEAVAANGVEAVEEVQAEAVEQPQKPAKRGVFDWSWQVFGAIILGVIGQRFLEPPDPRTGLALVLYLLAVILLGWGLWQKRWEIPPRMEENPDWDDAPIRWNRIFLAVPFMLAAFLLFGGNRFNLLNVSIWIIAIILTVSGFVIRRKKAGPSLWNKIKGLFDGSGFSLQISPAVWVAIFLVTIALFFRFGQLADIPGEMFSDHAEKLLDVNDVLNGQTSIFFPRNTGREAVQMYLTAFVSLVFGTGISFISLKLGTALAGFFTLPFIYLLAKEIGGKRLGFIAFFLAAIAYWPNVISRVGLRFPLYPLFVAPMLYFLVKGLKNKDRNQFIWAGLALGLGLHGYSPIRIVPFVVVILFAVFLLFPAAKGKRQQVMLGLIILAIVSFVVFLPLLRYSLEDPQMFAYRAFTRLGTAEREFPGSPFVIFFQNLWKSLVMFFYKNGNIWVHSVTNRPALDIVSAVFLFFGGLICLWRAVKQRSWVDAILLISVPLFMLPSILSLAFPDENPSLNRSGAAIIPVFIIAAIGMETLFTSLIKGMRGISGKILACGFIGFILLGAILQNYNLVFKQYKDQFDAGAWNTSQMGEVIRGFAESTGTFDTAYVVPVAHWVDTRLVGINAGLPTKDYALWPESFNETLSENRAKLFLLKGDDNQDLKLLLGYYPEAAVYLYDQKLEGKDFYIVYVPPTR